MEKQELASYLRPIDNNNDNDNDNDNNNSSSSSNSNEHGKQLKQSCSVVPCNTTASRRRTTPQIDGGSSVVRQDRGVRVIIMLYRCMRIWKRTWRKIRKKMMQKYRHTKVNSRILWVSSARIPTRWLRLCLYRRRT